MNNISIYDAASLTKEAISILKENGEPNWQSGLAIVVKCLEDDPPRLLEAKSIYQSMTADGRGFSEYNIWDHDYDARMKKNFRIDFIRQALWNFFQ